MSQIKLETVSQINMESVSRTKSELENKLHVSGQGRDAATVLAEILAPARICRL